MKLHLDRRRAKASLAIRHIWWYLDQMRIDYCYRGITDWCIKDQLRHNVDELIYALTGRMR